MKTIMKLIWLFLHGDLQEQARKKAIEYYEKALIIIETQDLVYGTLVRAKNIAKLSCEIDRVYEKRLYDICKACRIKYGKPDPEKLFDLILVEIQRL